MIRRINTSLTDGTGPARRFCGPLEYATETPPPRRVSSPRTSEIAGTNKDTGPSIQRSAARHHGDGVATFLRKTLRAQPLDSKDISLSPTEALERFYDVFRDDSFSPTLPALAESLVTAIERDHRASFDLSVGEDGGGYLQIYIYALSNYIRREEKTGRQGFRCLMGRFALHALAYRHFVPSVETGRSLDIDLARTARTFLERGLVSQHDITALVDKWRQCLPYLRETARITRTQYRAGLSTLEGFSSV